MTISSITLIEIKDKALNIRVEVLASLLRKDEDKVRFKSKKLLKQIQTLFDSFISKENPK